MTDSPGLRCRVVVSAESSLSGDRDQAGSAAQNDGSTMRVENSCPSWKFFLRWTARVLLVILFFLSSAKVVHIPDLEEGSSETAATVASFSSPIVLLVIAHSRPQYLQRCLESISRYHSTSTSGDDWAIAVSVDLQDGEPHEDVIAVAEKAKASFGSRMSIWKHEITYPDLTGGWDEGPIWVNVESYRRISRHYKWALGQSFRTFDAERVVILEDDMEVAPDFFSYFDALSPLLERDPTLFCVSAWNDNGKEQLAHDSKQLHRTDFFPGLGWMVTRSTWDELEPNWPALYWDDYLRSSSVTRGRQCIRPEVSRTANFGTHGVSQAFNHEKHVGQVLLNREPVKFSSQDLRYLDPVAYEKVVFGRMSNAVLLKYSNYLTSKPQNSDVIARHPAGSMEQIGKRTGVMTDHREGTFRTSYRGVVIIPWNGHWAFLVASDWEPPEGYTLGSSVCCN